MANDTNRGGRFSSRVSEQVEVFKSPIPYILAALAYGGGTAFHPAPNLDLIEYRLTQVESQVQEIRDGQREARADILELKALIKNLNR